MGLFTGYSDTNKIVLAGPYTKTTATDFVIGLYFATYTTTVYTEKFKYIFMTEAAATACLKAMNDAYTATVTEPSVSTGATTGYPTTTSSTQTIVDADCSMDRNTECGAYDVTVSVNRVRHTMSGWALTQS